MIIHHSVVHNFKNLMNYRQLFYRLIQVNKFSYIHLENIQFEHQTQWSVNGFNNLSQTLFCETGKLNWNKFPETWAPGKVP